MTPRDATLALLLAAWCVPASARAQSAAGRCPDARPWAPIALTLGGADFGASAPACAHDGLALDARVTALLDAPVYYGTLVAEGVLGGSHALGRRFWLSWAVTPLRYRYAQNATILAEDVGLGPSSVALHWTTLRPGDRLAVAPYVRALVPTDTGRQYAVTLGVELGAAVLAFPLPRVAVTGSAAVPVTVTVLGERTLTRVVARLALDAAVAVTPWLEPALGVELRLGDDPDGLLEYVAPKAALRVRPWRRTTFQAAAIAPLGGLERTDLRVALGVEHGW